MYKIPLSKDANQSLSFNLDGAFWTIGIYQAIDLMYADISRNGVLLISGVRCLVGEPLLPYRYLYVPNFGNFIFDSDPDWESFGETCNLFYLNGEEFSEYQNQRGA